MIWLEADFHFVFEMVQAMCFAIVKLIKQWDLVNDGSGMHSLNHEQIVNICFDMACNYSY